MTPRGHSNIGNINGVAKPSYDSESQRVRVPIQGGASIPGWHDLPDLYLSREEWEKIGRVVGWLKEVNK